MRLRTAGNELQSKSCEAESYEQCRRQQEWRAPRLEGAVALHGDGQSRRHSRPDDKLDHAEDQRHQTSTTIVRTSENEDCRASE